MNIENRLKLFKNEKPKILGYGRSHLRSVNLARRLESDVEKKIRKANQTFTSKQDFLFYLWDTIKSRGDELLRQEHFQFRVFDEGTVEFLDHHFIQLSGNGIHNKIEEIRDEISALPERVRAILQLHYQDGLSCKTIARKVGIPIEEVYQLWQHSLIYLWESLRDGDGGGFKEPDDEAFWTLALKYLDGTASEKFVSELNSEMHINKTRTKEFNDLRMIDGLIIGFGNLNLWPPCDFIKPSPFIAQLSSSKSKTDSFSDNGKKVENLPPTESLPHNAGQSGPAKIRQLFTSLFKAYRPRETPIENKSRPPALGLDLLNRNGLHLDHKRLIPKITLNPILIKRLGVLALIGLVITSLGAALVPRIFSPPQSAFRALRSVGLEIAPDSRWDGKSPAPGNRYIMTGGTMEFISGDARIIVEAPADFLLRSSSELVLKRGRMVVSIPTGLSAPYRIETDRFKFSGIEGEFGVVADDDIIDLLVFCGEGKLDNKDQQTGPDEGLRFYETGPPDSLVARDEAHRLPQSIPVIQAKAYGDNLIVNHSFEIGLLSRSCKTERLYRDIPLGWNAGWQKDGGWTEALEQHSGTVKITDAIGGLPTPVSGERYLWINHGSVAQELKNLEPGANYELSLKIASHRNLGPKSGQLVENIGGNTFRFGIWTGSEWIAEAHGQLEAGQAFQEMKLDFQFPSTGITGIIPTLMLTGETRIFYDEVVLKKK